MSREEKKRKYTARQLKTKGCSLRYTRNNSHDIPSCPCIREKLPQLFCFNFVISFPLSPDMVLMARDSDHLYFSPFSCYSHGNFFNIELYHRIGCM
jgi:hypothetical protein